MHYPFPRPGSSFYTSTAYDKALTLWCHPDRACALHLLHGWFLAEGQGPPLPHICAVPSPGLGSGSLVPCRGPVSPRPSYLCSALPSPALAPGCPPCFNRHLLMAQDCCLQAWTDSGRVGLGVPWAPPRLNMLHPQLFPAGAAQHPQAVSQGGCNHPLQYITESPNILTQARPGTPCRCMQGMLSPKII